MSRRAIYAGLLALVILVSACNMPLLPKATAGLEASVTEPPSAVASAAGAALPVTGGTGTPGAATGVQASVTAPTNCRSGPSVDYDVVFIAAPDQSFAVI